MQNAVTKSLFLATFVALAASLPAQEAKVPDAKAPEAKAAAGHEHQLKAVPQGLGGAGEATGGNAWFESTSQDMGTFYGQGEAVGVFKFSNPRDQAIDWVSLNPSCQCAKAEIRVGGRTYRLISKPTKRLLRVVQSPGQPERLEDVSVITIGPKESGEVETHLDMQNITGPKMATLNIHGTDPEVPQTQLSFRATGAELFVISPKEVNLNKMTWNESREFTVTVQSPLKPDWKIVGMDDAPSFDVRWERETVGDRTVWKIHGKYGPVNEEVGGGGVLRFRTDVNGAATFNVRVLAFVQGPLEVKPGGFLTLGLIRKGQSLKKEIVFEPNDGIDLDATELEFQKMSLSSEFISATSRKDGQKLVVELTVADNAPTGLVKGDLVVHLNHPLVKEKRIMFNGFVR